MTKRTSLLTLAVLLCGMSGQTLAKGASPSVEARAKLILIVSGKRFKDLNANGKLDPYEDWRLPVAQASQ